MASAFEAPKWRTFRFEMEAILAALRDLTDLAHCGVDRS
jgi:hypothetical protein